MADWLIGRLALTAAKLDHDWIRPLVTAVLPTRVTTALYSCTRGLFLHALSKSGFEPIASPPGAERRVMGLIFRNDLGNAAGLDKDGVMLEWFWRSGAGFCVIGTVLDSSHTGNNWIFGRFCPWLPLPAGGNGLNSLGLPSKGVQKALDNIARFKQSHSKADLAGFPIGLSVMGHPAKHGAEKLEGVLECVRKACDVVDFIELNESCPNVNHGQPSVKELEERLSQVVAARDEAAKAAGRKVPLLIKLGSLDALGNVETTVLTLAKLGCEGVVGLNTQKDYDNFFDDMPASDVTLLQQYTKHYGGGLSGPVIFPRSLQQVAEAKRLVDKHGLDLAIVHVGGIVDPKDMVASRATGVELREWYTGLFTAIATRPIASVYPGMVEVGRSDKDVRSPSPNPRNAK